MTFTPTKFRIILEITKDDIEPGTLKEELSFMESNPWSFITDLFTESSKNITCKALYQNKKGKWVSDILSNEK